MAQENVVGFDDVALEEIIDVEQKAWGELAADKDEIKKRLDVHPEGFVGVTNGDELVGYAYGIRYNHDEVDPRTWYEATDFST